MMRVLLSMKLMDNFVVDLTRSQKAVSIFNMYWDKFQDGLKAIEYGQGTYNPKLWGEVAKTSKKKK